MINSFKFEKPHKAVNYSIPYSKSNKYMIYNQTLGTIREKQHSEVRGSTLLTFTKSASCSKQTFKSTHTLSSTNLHTRDRDRSRNTSHLISSNSLTKYASRNTLSKTDSMSMNMKTITSKGHLTSNPIKPKLNQCKGMSNTILNRFRTKPISQLTSIHLKKKKGYPMIVSKKRIPYQLPQTKDLDYKMTPESFLYRAFFDVERNRTREAHMNMNAIQKEIMLEYGFDFKILRSDVFIDHKLASVFNIKGKLTEDDDKAMVSLCFHKKSKTLEDATVSQLNKHNRVEMNNKRRQLYEKFKGVMFKAAMHFVKCKITINEFYDYKYETIPKFEGNEIYALIEAIKDNNTILVTSMVYKNKYLLFDTDHFNQTPLHWACKRNMYKVISLMVSKGANLYAIDIAYRTPLHIAAQSNKLESTTILLFALADPLLTTNFNATPFDLAQSYPIRCILKRAEDIHNSFIDRDKTFLKKEVRAALKALIETELMISFTFFAKYIY